MELDKFIEKFAEQFDDTDMSEFHQGVVFRDLEEWSSLNALSIIAMVDEEYNVKLTGGDIREVNTIKELYDVVNSKK